MKQQRIMLNIKKFEFNMFPVNCYLLWDEDTREAAVIDPGLFFDEEKTKFASFVKSENIVMRHLLCTHLHIDHVMGCRFVEDTFGIGIEACREDEWMLPDMPQHARLFGFSFDDAGMKVSKYLKGGDTVAVGKYALTVLDVPGHSPGGLAYYLHDADVAGADYSNVLFSGDTLFAGCIGRTDLYGGDHEAILRSIRTRLFTLPDDTVVFPGHGPASTIGREKRDNIYVK